MRELIYRLNDDNKDVLKAGHKAWTALSKHVPAEESVKHIEFMRNLINSMVSEARRRKGGVGDGEFFLPGFNIPKGEFALSSSSNEGSSCINMRTILFQYSLDASAMGVI